jgi:hypothetical protein
MWVFPPAGSGAGKRTEADEGADLGLMHSLLLLPDLRENRPGNDPILVTADGYWGGPEES